jgi:hypothetical protein
MGKRNKPAWEDNFIRLLGQMCNVTLAAKGAGIDRTTAYQYRRNSTEFAKRWKEAKSEAIELLEAKAWQRAQSTSDTLMIFLLKANKPNKYQDRSKIVHEFSVKELDQLRQIKALLSKTDTPASDMFNDLIAELQAQDAEHS